MTRPQLHSLPILHSLQLLAPTSQLLASTSHHQFAAELLASTSHHQFAAEQPYPSSDPSGNSPPSWPMPQIAAWAISVKCRLLATALFQPPIWDSSGEKLPPASILARGASSALRHLSCQWPNSTDNMPWAGRRPDISNFLADPRTSGLLHPFWSRRRLHI